jgi:hypothetical protein
MRSRLGLLTRSRATLDHFLSAGRPFARQAGTVNVETVVLTLFFGFG